MDSTPSNSTRACGISCLRSALSAMKHRCEDPWRASFFYSDVAELLRVPVVLSLVRGLKARGRLKPFRTRGELYAQVHLHLLERAAAQLGFGNDPDKIMRWRDILAAVAFRM